MDSSGKVDVVDDFEGSGIAITPVHFLTAGHVVYNDEANDKSKAKPIASRVTVSEEQKELVSRTIGNPKDEDANVNRTDIKFLANDFRITDDNNDDIALLRTNLPLLREDKVIGLIAFVDPKDAAGFDARAAGYPADNVSEPILDGDGKPGSGRVARDLVAAPGLKFSPGMVKTTQNPRLFFVNQNVDLYDAQSGSGVWHSYEDEDLRILGLLNFDKPNVPDDGNGLIELNGGVIFTTDLYTEIINQTEADIGTGNADKLPENLIIGSNSGIASGIAGNDRIVGTYRRERIIGNKGNDTIFGAGANDRLEGGEGDDKLTGGSGDDLIDGGTNSLAIINPFNRENDVAIFSADRSEYEIETQTTGGIIGIGEETVTVVTHLNDGIDGQDTLSNIEFLLFADGSIPIPSDDDALDDLLNFFGGSSNDNIVGNVLANLLLGEAGNDRLVGDDGDDTLKGHSGNDSLFGGDDDDLLQGGGDNDRLDGNAGEDRLFGGRGNDILRGGDDNDTLAGGLGFGRDTLKGQGGDDSITGGGGNDLLQGGDDEDILKGNGGDDRLFGDAGNDLLYGEDGDDYLSGGDGLDTLKGEDGEDYLTGENGNDLLQGGNGNDELNGDGGRDRLYGNEDNDLLRGGTNNDYLVGSDGSDTLKGENGNDTLVGSDGDDLLQGGASKDRLYGGGNNDRLFGNDGDDRLFGGTGENTIAGGAGLDDFVFTSLGQSVDEITDFTVEDDTLQFKVESFAGISTVGMISSNMLTIGSSASDSNHRFVYNSGSGDLFYDSDGSGSSQQVKLAELDAGLAMTNSDFEVI